MKSDISSYMIEIVAFLLLVTKYCYHCIFLDKLFSIFHHIYHHLGVNTYRGAKISAHPSSVNLGILLTLPLYSMEKQVIEKMLCGSYVNRNVRKEYYMNKAKYLIVSLFVVFASVLSGCTSVNENSEQSLTKVDFDEQSAEEYFVNYMEACETEESTDTVKYLHFEQDVNRQAYIDSGEYSMIAEYEIESIKQINENLFAITFTASTQMQPDISRTYFNFVGNIDNQIYVMTGVNEIPENISESLDKSEFVYSDPDIIMN